QAAIHSLEEVDIVCHLVDAAALLAQMKRSGSKSLPGEEHYVLTQLERVDKPRVLVINKVDIVKDRMEILPLIDELMEQGSYTEVVPVSALTEDNVDVLVDVLLGLLPEEAPLFPEDMLTDQAEYFMASEFIREQVMIQTRKEIPYSVAVEIERFEDAPGGDVLEISAVINVERDTQKGIIIGQGGERIKSIGTEARKQMETFFGRRVFLETFVRVEPSWSENPRHLKRFGYE
ncbi:MAG: GTPase Era, partial [Bradymonadaceae bacterium]